MRPYDSPGNTLESAHHFWLLDTFGLGSVLIPLGTGQLVTDHAHHRHGIHTEADGPLGTGGWRGGEEGANEGCLRAE